VDVHALTTGTWRQAIDIPSLGRELLEGMTLPACPGFEAWLLATRRRLAGAAEDVLLGLVVVPSRLTIRLLLIPAHGPR
jgi:hypothetical protein